MTTESPAADSAAGLTASGLSTTGEVEARVTGARLSALKWHPDWRRSTREDVLQVEIAEATNSALAEYTHVLAQRIQADPPATGLSEIVRTTRDHVTEQTILDAMDELAVTLDHVEASTAPPDYGTATPPAPVTQTTPDASIAVSVVQGVVTQIAIESMWLRRQSDESLAAALIPVINGAMNTYLAARLEAQAAAVGGRDGVSSALYEGQTYVTSAVAMRLERK